MKQRSLLCRSFATAAVLACLLTGCSDDRNKVERSAAEGESQVEGSPADFAELATQLARLNQQIATSSDESKRQRAEIIALLVEIRTELRNR